MSKRKRRLFSSVVEAEELADGKVVLTLRHHKGDGQWAKFLIVGGGNLVFRAIEAVYDKDAGDADAFFEANGMSDEQAFDKDTWR